MHKHINYVILKICSEFWTGWLDIWGIPHQTIEFDSLIKTLTEILDSNANVNMYMFHGGTNFGFSSGKYFYILIRVK